LDELVSEKGTLWTEAGWNMDILFVRK